MEHRISATHAARSFAEIANRVRYRGESFLVERAGVPVCRIIPAGRGPVRVRDLIRLLDTGPKPDPGFALDLQDVVRRGKKDLPKSCWPS